MAKRKAALAKAVKHARGWGEISEAFAAAPWLDAAALSTAVALSWGLAAGMDYRRLKGQIPEGEARRFSDRPRRFADDVPWGDALDSFLQRKIVGARDFEEWLSAIDDALEAGVIPEFFPLQQQAYGSVFTMVREADATILARVDDLVAKAIGEGLTPGDFVQDLDDLYRSLGLREQEGNYAELVYNNAVNRAAQEGRDALATDEDGRPKSWVWGYLWRHGGSQHPRPTHLAMDGHQAPAGDPIWATFGPPPIAHNCSCARHTIGRTRAEELGLDQETDFPVPTVTATALGAAEVKDVKKYSGRPVDEVVKELPGERFPRSQFNLPDRALINPSEIKLS